MENIFSNDLQSADEGQKVAGVHQYLRVDGTLGASGRPDPKELLIGGVLYIIDTTAVQGSM